MMPAVFVGHGSPMNAVTETVWGAAWRDLGASIGRPRAVVCVSAHWFRVGTAATAMAAPRTIHDFYGFPEELFSMRYAAPGSPELARELGELLAPLPVEQDTSWGLDHGAWSVLVHMYPDGDVPVVQLSIDAAARPEHHLAIGESLAVLRADDVLVLGSGNVVHNLGVMDLRPTAAPYDWAVEFDGFVRDCLDEREDDALVGYLTHPAARLAAPTPEHFLPLLYVVGAAGDGEAPRFVAEGIVDASVSMLSVRFG